jgi:radical SAM protein with 4Fe4S-binding SPASM domain
MGWLKDLWKSQKDPGLDPGTYKYDGIEDLKGHRFHLRVDNKEKGVLIVDASKLIFLNGTALDLVRCMLEGKSSEETYRYMKKRYRRVRDDIIYEHYAGIRAQIKEFLKGDMDVIQNIGAESPSIGADELPSPYRMDLALTYDCQNNCAHCYNEDRTSDPLSKEQWLKVLERLWDIGIPHVVFTGGEPTEVSFLRDLIDRSEELGQITGLISNGRNLARMGYLKELVETGLDHVQITVLSHRESLHDRLVGSKGAWKETISGLRAALDEDIYVNTNTTIMRSTIEDVEETMRYLADLGVRNIAFNSIIRSGKGKSTEGVTFEELEKVLDRLKAFADERDINMIWYSPTPYCEFNPINHDLGIKQCTACSINMAIEPDGTVLPCQSCYEPLGNILRTRWDDIWDHKLCMRIRERSYVPKKCRDCDLLDVCGGGCPLSLKHGDYLCADRSSSM